MTTDLTFEQLPMTIAQLYKKVERIEQLLENKELSNNEIDQILSIKEAAIFLNLSQTTIYRKVSKCLIPFYKKSNRLYFSKRALIEWISTGRVKSIQ